MLGSLSNKGAPFIFPSEVTSDVYRSFVGSKDLITSRVLIKQTDLLISGLKDLGQEAEMLARKYRRQIEDYIETHPYFARAMSPVPRDPFAPRIINTMIESSARANVGPMACVAGAIAEYVGLGLLPYSQEVIVENGGDSFVFSRKKKEFLLLAETCELAGLRIALQPSDRPIGVCTSSGKSGHSLSLGEADAVMAFGPSASLADAAATAIANIVKDPSHVKEGIRISQEIGLFGVVILIGDHMGAWGEIEFLG